MRRHLSTIATATLAMGIAVTLSWFAFGRISAESFGLDPASMATPHRLMIYASQFLLVGLIGYGVTRWRLRGESLGTLARVLLAAWIGEGLVLTVIGEPIVANELSPLVAWYFWLVATAGPLQPLVAFLGGWAALNRSSERPPSGPPSQPR